MQIARLRNSAVMGETHLGDVTTAGAPTPGRMTRSAADGTGSWRRLLCRATSRARSGTRMRCLGGRAAVRHPTVAPRRRWRDRGAQGSRLRRCTPRRRRLSFSHSAGGVDDCQVSGESAPRTRNHRVVVVHHPRHPSLSQQLVELRLHRRDDVPLGAKFLCRTDPLPLDAEQRLVA